MSRLKKIVAQVPQSKTELEAMVKTTIEMQTEREQLVAQRDAARLNAEKPFAARISDLDTLMARNLELVEAWAEDNRPEFGENKSLDIAGHTIGWRLGNWKTALAKKTKWADVLYRLRDWINDLKDKPRNAAAFRWLRIKEEPNKEAMIAERHDDNAAALLTELGVEIVQDETFYLDPNREGQDPALLTSSNS